MRTELKWTLVGGLALCVLQGPARAQDKPAFKDDKAKASYAFGVSFGNYVKGNDMDVDLDEMVAAAKDVLTGREMKLTQAQAQEAIRSYQMAAQQKAAQKNKKEGEAFLAENKKKDGVKIQDVKLADGSTAEMQYKVITEGTGAIPKSNDTVNVIYRGRLINGQEVDSSAKRGPQPARIPLKAAGVPRGWTEALQMMKVGSKWELYLPASLAFGEMRRPGIEPGSTLIFEMELVGIGAPPPPPPLRPLATQPPLTSDIIKVPSKEDLDKGAKIEVIKAEDAARMQQEAQSQQTNSMKKQP